MTPDERVLWETALKQRLIRLKKLQEAKAPRVLIDREKTLIDQALLKLSEK